MRKVVVSKVFILFATVALYAGLAYAESRTIFTGTPIVKISEGGSSRIPEKLEMEKVANLKCILSKIDGQYFWASRENTKLLRVDSGAFITFVAPNGSGYVRIINPELKETASMMSETEEEFDYVEHLLIGLRSVTYYGKTEFHQSHP
jgi:hypothetical protein